MAKDAQGNEIEGTEGDGDDKGASPEEIVIDGETFTAQQVREGLMRSNDYTQKTQQVATMRKDLESKLAEVESKSAASDEASAKTEARIAALQTDIEWYKTHPQNEWDDYKPAVYSEGGDPPVSKPNDPPSNGSATLDDETKQDLKSIKESLKSREERENLEASEKAVDVVLDEVDKLNKGDYPLADKELVGQAIEAHQGRNNGALPTLVEVHQIMKSIHDRFKKAGAPIPAGHVKVSSKGDITPSAQVVSDPKHAQLDLKNDPDSVENALKDYMSAKLAEKE